MVLKKKPAFALSEKKYPAFQPGEKKIICFSGRRKKKDGLTINNPGPPRKSNGPSLMTEKVLPFTDEVIVTGKLSNMISLKKLE